MIIVRHSCLFVEYLTNIPISVTADSTQLSGRVGCLGARYRSCVRLDFFLLVVRILQLKKRKLIYNTIITARFRGGGGGSCPPPPSLDPSLAILHLHNNLLYETETNKVRKRTLFNKTRQYTNVR